MLDSRTRLRQSSPTTLEVLMRCLSALVIFAASIGFAHADPDQCRDILVYAARNQNQSLSISNMNSEVKNALCNGSSLSNSSSSRLGGGISVFGYGSGGFDKSKQNLQAAQNQSCSSADSTLSKDQFDKVMSDLVDHYAVDAWHKCIDKGGLVGAIERNGKTVVFHLRWIAAYGVDRTKLTDVQIDGVGCTSLWPVGTAISSVNLRKQCSGDPDTPVTVTFQAENDSLSLTSPAAMRTPVTPPAKRVSRRERCLAGESDQCGELAEDIERNCGQQFPGRTGRDGAGWRMCVQAAQPVKDVMRSLQQAELACAGDVDSQQCYDAQARRDLLKAQMSGALPPDLPQPPMGLPYPPK